MRHNFASAISWLFRKQAAALRGYVVRIEAQAEKDRTAVGIVFTE